MTGFLEYLARLLGAAAFWVIVQPWQQGLRTRAGRHARLLGPGLYLKLPVLDQVRVESVRRRSAMLPTQTLSTADGHSLTVGAVIFYRIENLERLFCGLHHAEDTISQTGQGLVAQEVFSAARDDLKPDGLAARLSVKLQGALTRYGLAEVEFQVTDFAYVRAIRLMQDSRWSHGAALNTEDQARPAR